MTVKGGGGAPSGPRQKTPWLMCIRCTYVDIMGGMYNSKHRSNRALIYIITHLVRVERHVDGGDPVEVRPDEGGDAGGVMTRWYEGDCDQTAVVYMCHISRPADLPLIGQLERVQLDSGRMRHDRVSASFDV